MANRGRADREKQLAEERSRRLEAALQSYSADKTKQTVGKLLEDYIDENGTNYFAPGSHNTTLYFADDDYIKEVEKVRLADDEELAKGTEQAGEKAGFLNWFLDRAKKTIEDIKDIPSGESAEDENRGSNAGFEMPDPEDMEKHGDRLANGVRPSAVEQDEELTEDHNEQAPEETAEAPAEAELAEEMAEAPVESELAEETAEAPAEAELAEETAEAPVESELAEETTEAPAESELAEETAEAPAESELAEEMAEAPVESELAEETAEAAAESELAEEMAEAPAESELAEEMAEAPAESELAEETAEAPVESELAEEMTEAAVVAEENTQEAPLETIVANKPVLTEETIKAEQEKQRIENKENEAVKVRENEMNYTDDLDETPKRRRAKKAKGKQPELNEEYDDDFDDDEDEEPKKSFFSRFKKHKADEDSEDYAEDDIEPEDDYDEDDAEENVEESVEDEYDDEDDFDDDFDDDDDYDEPGISIKKILLIIFIILLVGAVTALAAVCYSYKTKFDSATSQIQELQNQGVTAADGSTDADTEVASLQAQVAALTAENTRLKGAAGTAAETPTQATTAQSVTQAVQVVDSDSVVQQTTASTASASGKTYTIKEGDTGSKICAEVYGEYTEENWNKILQANGMTTSTVYHPGQVLNIP